MLQFIPFEDDWDALENLRPEDLIPYQIGLLDRPDQSSQRTGSSSPVISSASPNVAPIRWAVPAESSNT